MNCGAIDIGREFIVLRIGGTQTMYIITICVEEESCK